MGNYSLKYAPTPWLDRSVMEPGRPWVNRFSASTADATLLASCFAVLARDLYGSLADLPAETRTAWADYIAAHQSAEDGYFHDPIFTEADLVKKRHGVEYLTWQFTFFSLAALHVLGRPPAHPLRFLDEFLQRQPLEDWLARLEWADPWLVSNRIMFMASFLIQEGERAQDPVYGAAVDRIFDWLDAHQNPETGFWDLDCGADLHNTMAAAFHFYYLYFYLCRPVNHVEKIIDHTLALQHADGLFSPAGGGGACLDLDAVDILVKFSLLVDYRAAEVKAALTRTFEALLNNQNADGGFCEAKRPPIWKKSTRRKLLEAVGLDRLLGKPWQGRPIETVNYSGWGRMRHRVDESDLWAAWFRPLALAVISARYPGEFIDAIPWRFHNAPVLGWHDAARLRALRERYYA